MERMEYDPEGGDYKPVTEHETGSTFMVVGLIMLIAARRLDAVCRLGHSRGWRSDAGTSSLPTWSSPWVYSYSDLSKRNG